MARAQERAHQSKDAALHTANKWKASATKALAIARQQAAAQAASMRDNMESEITARVEEKMRAMRWVAIRLYYS